MSEENVEIVRRWIEAYNRRDMKELIELDEADFVFRSVFVAVEAELAGNDHEVLVGLIQGLEVGVREAFVPLELRLPRSLSRARPAADRPPRRLRRDRLGGDPPPGSAAAGDAARDRGGPIAPRDAAVLANFLFVALCETAMVVARAPEQKAAQREAVAELGRVRDGLAS